MLLQKCFSLKKFKVIAVRMFHERSSNTKLQWELTFQAGFVTSHAAQHKDISIFPVLQRATEWIWEVLCPRKLWDCQLQVSRLPGPPRLARSWLNLSLNRHEAGNFKALGSHSIQVPRFLGQLWLLGAPVPLHPEIPRNPRPEAQSQLIRLAVSEPGLHFLSQIIMKNNYRSNWYLILKSWKTPETTWIIEWEIHSYL